MIYCLCKRDNVTNKKENVMNTERLQKAVRTELRAHMKITGKNTINMMDAVKVFAKGYFNDFTEGSLVSDSVLLSSIGYSHGLRCLPEFLKLDLGFTQEFLDGLLGIEHDFKREIFAIRNKDQFNQMMFSFSDQNIDLYEKNLKNTEMVDYISEVIKRLKSI
jgi:hypothetical protein